MCSKQRKDLEEHRKKMPEFKDFWDAQEGILDCLDLCKIDEKFLHDLLNTIKNNSNGLEKNMCSDLSEKVKVYKVSCPDISQNFCAFKDLLDALQEVATILTEAEEYVTIQVDEMTEEEYSNLPEFDGY